MYFWKRCFSMANFKKMISNGLLIRIHLFIISLFFWNCSSILNFYSLDCSNMRINQTLIPTIASFITGIVFRTFYFFCRSFLLISSQIIFLSFLMECWCCINWKTISNFKIIKIHQKHLQWVIRIFFLKFDSHSSGFQTLFQLNI